MSIVLVLFSRCVTRECAPEVARDIGRAPYFRGWGYLRRRARRTSDPAAGHPGLADEGYAGAVREVEVAGGVEDGEIGPHPGDERADVAAGQRGGAGLGGRTQRL